jgi:hypothetical protein
MHMPSDRTDWGSIIVSPPDREVRRGRRPLNGAQAMTGAERARRYRELRNAVKPKKKTPPIVPELLPGPLTAQIAQDSFVRRLIDASFPSLSTISRACNKKLRDQGLRTAPRVHPEKVVAMLVGTAIDLRARCHFHRDIHRSGRILLGLLFFQRWSRKRKCLDQLFDAFEKFIARVKPERRSLPRQSEQRLCKYCILFAYLDFIGRNPFGNSAIDVLTSIASRDPKKTLARIDSTVVADVMALSRLFYDNHAAMIAKAGEVTVGGTLSGSEDIGGADFDLLVDGCLVEFKAVRNAKVTTQILRQLVGYWLLDYDDALKIRKFAVCLLRHGYTEYFGIGRDLLPSAPFPVLRSNFRKALAHASKRHREAGVARIERSKIQDQPAG